MFFRIVLLGIFLVALSGCGNKLKGQIVGKWEGTRGGKTETIEFAKNGKAIYTTDGKTVEKTYRFIDDTTLEVSEPSGGSKSVYTVQIVGSELQLTTPDLGMERYQRK